MLAKLSTDSLFAGATFTHVHHHVQRRAIATSALTLQSHRVQLPPSRSACAWRRQGCSAGPRGRAGARARRRPWSWPPSRRRMRLSLYTDAPGWRCMRRSRTTVFIPVLLLGELLCQVLQEHGIRGREVGPVLGVGQALGLLHPGASCCTLLHPAAPWCILVHPGAS